MPLTSINGTKAGLTSQGASNITAAPGVAGGFRGTISTGGSAGVNAPVKTTTAPPPPTVSTTFKQQVFNVVCTGMKPNTIHKFYYEGVERGQDCIPVYPKPTSTNVVPGSELKTDSQGMIEFNFYFTLDVERQVDNVNNVAYAIAGDKKFELRATDSSAYKIVPFTKVVRDLTLGNFASTFASLPF